MGLVLGHINIELPPPGNSRVSEFIIIILRLINQIFPLHYFMYGY